MAEGGTAASSGAEATISDLATELWDPPYQSVHVDWTAEPSTIATINDNDEAPVSPTTPGVVLLARYRVDAALGYGGTGVVVRAFDARTGRDVAIKLLKPDLARDPAQVDRFLREARAMLTLRGDHTARVLDFGQHADGTPIMVMELLDGPDLSRILQHEGLQHPTRVVEWMLQTCEGLAEAHALGIIHRDIKLSNLVLTATRDGGFRIKIVDFGTSKHPDPLNEPTGTGAVLGTPPYMAPEHLWQSRAVDQRSDIWSIGVVMYRLITGRMPFDTESLEGLRAVIAARGPSPIGVRLPAGLGEVILRCLQKDPELRFQTVAQLAFALARFASSPALGWASADRIRRILFCNTPVPGPLPAVAVEPPVPTRRRRIKLSRRSIGVIVLTAAAVMGTVLGAWSESATRASTPEAESATEPPSADPVAAPTPVEPARPLAAMITAPVPTAATLPPVRVTITASTEACRPAPQQRVRTDHSSRSSRSEHRSSRSEHRSSHSEHRSELTERPRSRPRDDDDELFASRR